MYKHNITHNNPHIHCSFRVCGELKLFLTFSTLKRYNEKRKIQQTNEKSSFSNFEQSMHWSLSERKTTVDTLSPLRLATTIVTVVHFALLLVVLLCVMFIVKSFVSRTERWLIVIAFFCVPPCVVHQSSSKIIYIFFKKKKRFVFNRHCTDLFVHDSNQCLWMCLFVNSS